MYLSVGIVWAIIFLLALPVIWAGWWLAASAGEKVGGRKYVPHQRSRY